MKTIIRIAALLALACIACAEQNVIWQIGNFDNDDKEFAISGDYTLFTPDFRRGVTFRPGKDDPAKAWPFVHPGLADAWAESRDYAFTILFNLDQPPAGTFTLTIDLADTHGASPPTYQISVNDASDYLRLPEGSGAKRPGASQGKEYVLDLPLPASLFHQGENKIVLRNIEGSWLTYDALKLTNDPSAAMPEPSIESISLNPTALLVRDGSKLKQIVELAVRFSPGASERTAEVRVGDQSSGVQLKPGLLGSAQSEVLVDEVARPTDVQVSVASGSQTKTASCKLEPARHWKIYLQPSSHVDIGFTDHQDKCAERHNDNMSLALDLCDEHPGFKWNTEVAWVEDNYLSMMPDDRKAQFFRLAKEGRIGCEAIYGNMLTGICSHESFIRDLYFAHSIAKQHGIPYDIAMSSDVPSQVWTLPTILAGSGIKYFSAGLNITRGNSVEFFDKSPFYWQGPDGSKVLTWFALRYRYANRLGLTDDVEKAKPLVQSFLKSYERPDYPYDAVLGFGGYGDNRALEAKFADVVDAWNAKYAYPKVIHCRGPEFFEYLEANFKGRIPTISGDGGVYWEDGAGSSALETSLVRQAKEKLASAEKLFTLTGAEYPKADFESAWKNAILFDEHTWGASTAVRDPSNPQTIYQWKVKSQFAYDAAKAADALVQRGLTGLAQEGSVVVFNPLSWPVSGPVSLDGHQFWAENVPAFGYGTYWTNGSNETHTTHRSHVSHSALENQHYRVSFDPATGAIKSLYDKELNRELVDPAAPYGLNQYLYIKGQGKDARPVTGIKNVSIAYRKTPFGESVLISGSAYRTPKWTTEVILYDKIKRIDFINTINKDETFEKEAGYFAFPFSLSKPEFYVELPDGIVRPKSQMMEGGCMQWYCLQDFVAAADDKAAVVWTAVDSPLVTIGDINRETFKSPLPIENGHLYAYVFNNYWFTNYKAGQGGELTFRFSLTSMPKYDPVAASHFGQSVRNPLMAVASHQPLAISHQPFCSVNPGNITIQAVKQAESGGGTIIRLRELSGRDTRATLKGRFNQAWSCNLVEDIQSPLKVTQGKVEIPVRTVWQPY